ALARMGKINDIVRLPLVSLSAKHRPKMEELLMNLHIIRKLVK
ncbi:MAG: hypothetical protein AAB071_00765, partial [Bacteroidota bacterium]